MPTDREMFRSIVLNVAMGASLGASFMGLLFVLNVHSISQTLQHSTSPIAVIIILVAGASMYFAFGAAITGFHFTIMDERQGGSRR